MKLGKLVLKDTGMFSEGMQIKSGIYYLYKNSYVLLCRDIVLTDKLITKLQNVSIGTGGVYIEENSYEDIWNESLRQLVTPFKILAQFKANRFSELDGEVVNIFLNNIAYLLVGMQVRLSNGEEGEVDFVRPADYAYPIIKVGSRVFTTDEACKSVYVNRNSNRGDVAK